MKRVIIITGIVLVLVIGCFSFLVYEDLKYSNMDTTKYEEKINKIDKEIEKNSNEVTSIKEANPEKVKLLELWENEVEKAKNY